MRPQNARRKRSKRDGEKAWAFPMTGPDFPQPHSKQVRGVVTGDTRRKERVFCPQKTNLVAPPEALVQVLAW